MPHEGCSAGRAELSDSWQACGEISALGHLQLSVSNLSGHGDGGDSEYDAEIQRHRPDLRADTVYPDSHGGAGDRDEVLPDSHFHLRGTSGWVHPGGRL